MLSAALEPEQGALQALDDVLRTFLTS